MMKSKSRRRKAPKRLLALPDLEHAKTAVLNSLTSSSGQRTYEHAIQSNLMPLARIAARADASIRPGRPGRTYGIGWSASYANAWRGMLRRPLHTSNEVRRVYP